MKPATDGYILIDPPVNSFSSKVEIQAWIAELEQMPANPEVLMALDQAKRLLDPSRPFSW
jgi:hypothetical protein